MTPQSYYYNCSSEYIQSIEPDLHPQIVTIINQLPKRQSQSQINADIFWLLTSKGWNYDTVLQGTGNSPPPDLKIETPFAEIRNRNNRNLCLTSTTLDTRWHSDFAKNNRDRYFICDHSKILCNEGLKSNNKGAYSATDPAIDN